MLNLALIWACGINLDKRKNVNQGARDVFDSLRAVLNSMNASAGALEWFQHAQLAYLNTSVKLKNVAPTRWSSVSEVRLCTSTLVPRHI